MGNHDVGRGMAAAARVFWLAMGDRKPTKEQALAALDAAAEEYRGADAEFDDELHEETDLSRLVAVAFDATPEEIASLKGELASESEDDTGIAWYDGPETKFRERYEFC